MRKILFSVLLAVLLIFTGFVIYRGTNVGKFTVWGVTQISEENNKIDQKNAELTNLVNETYPQTLSRLNASADTFQKTKKDYEDQAVLVKNNKYYKQTETYKMEFLWTRIGNYAKDNKVDLKLDIASGDTSELYNLNFTVTGKYANVAQFIYDIENDSRLGFKIEYFSMAAGGIVTTTTVQDGEVKDVSTTGAVTGIFTCKEIRIDVQTLDSTSSSSNFNLRTQQQNNTENITENTTQNTTQNTTTQNSPATDDTVNNTSENNTTQEEYASNYIDN